MKVGQEESCVLIAPSGWQFIRPQTRLGGDNWIYMGKRGSRFHGNSRYLQLHRRSSEALGSRAPSSDRLSFRYLGALFALGVPPENFRTSSRARAFVINSRALARRARDVNVRKGSRARIVLSSSPGIFTLQIAARACLAKREEPTPRAGRTRVETGRAATSRQRRVRFDLSRFSIVNPAATQSPT